MKHIFPASLLGISLFLFSISYSSAGNLPVSASCTIYCAVEDTAEWVSNNKSINPAERESEDDLSGETESLMLYTNSDVEIIADRLCAAPSSSDGRSFSNRYILHYDVAAAELTGSRIIAWSDFDSFPGGLSYAADIPAGCAIEVILSVNNIQNSSMNVDKASFSSPRQTLTVCWK